MHEKGRPDIKAIRARAKLLADIAIPTESFMHLSASHDITALLTYVAELEKIAGYVTSLTSRDMFEDGTCPLCGVAIWDTDPIPHRTWCPVTRFCTLLEKQ